MPSYPCNVCGRQLATKTIRDRHQLRCECAAYDEIHIQTQRDNAIRWMKANACNNCGQVHIDEPSQIKCDENQWIRDEAFSQLQSDRLTEISGTRDHVSL